MPSLLSFHLHHHYLPLLDYFPTKIHLKKIKKKHNFSTFVSIHSNMSVSRYPNSLESRSISSIAPIEAVLFDIDGTLCDSDPLHFHAFRVMLQEVGFNGGVPIDENFFIENISGKHNDEISGALFPDWELQKALQFMEDKEALFRKLASEKLTPVKGLKKLQNWVEEHGLKCAAVTNAPRPNAELILSSLGLSDFFEKVVIGGECERAKPFPDPYLKGLEELKVSSDHTLVFEDSVSGTRAGVAAGMPVVALTTGNPEHLLMKAGASLVINNFEDPKLWTALEEIEGKAAKVTPIN